MKLRHYKACGPPLTALPLSLQKCPQTCPSGLKSTSTPAASATGWRSTSHTAKTQQNHVREGAHDHFSLPEQKPAVTTTTKTLNYKELRHVLPDKASPPWLADSWSELWQGLSQTGLLKIREAVRENLSSRSSVCASCGSFCHSIESFTAVWKGPKNDSCHPERDSLGPEHGRMDCSLELELHSKSPSKTTLTDFFLTFTPIFCNK